MREVRDERIARQRCDAVTAVHGGVDAVGSKADDGACDEDGHDDDENAQPERHFPFLRRGMRIRILHILRVRRGISALSAGRRVLPRLRLGVVVCIAIRWVSVLRGVWLRVVRVGLIRRLRGIIAGMLNGLRLRRNVHVRDGLGFRRLLGIRERLCRGGIGNGRLRGDSRFCGSGRFIRNGGLCGNGLRGFRCFGNIVFGRSRLLHFRGFVFKIVHDVIPHFWIYF